MINQKEPQTKIVPKQVEVLKIGSKHQAPSMTLYQSVNNQQAHINKNRRAEDSKSRTRKMSRLTNYESRNESIGMDIDQSNLSRYLQDRRNKPLARANQNIAPNTNKPLLTHTLINSHTTRE